jgi:DNA polymerase (family 10)
MTIEDLIEAALEKGYSYMAITNHSKLVRIANGMDEKRLLKHAEHVRKISRKYKNIKVLAGVEVDILRDGTLDLKDTALKELDIVIAAVHSNFSADRNSQTERLIRALDNRYVNILAHPSGRLITKRDPLDFDKRKVFSKASQNNVILEINTHGERVDLNDIDCMLAKELGAKFAVNTDSHQKRHMDGMKLGVSTARRAWLEKKDVVNTYTFDELRKVLKRG